MSSHYTRTDSNSGTTFNVVPAPYPVGPSGWQTAFWIAVAIVGVPLIPVVIGLWMVPAGIYFAFVTHQARKAGLAGFVVTHAEAGASSDRVHVVRSNAHAVALNAGLQLKASQQHVSFQTSVRLKSDSRPEPLVGGLTEQTARALAEDLVDAVSREGK